MGSKIVENPGLSNPAVVGLAGFGGTTLLLQFHNLGWSGTGCLLWTALFFGGLMQLIAGFKEFSTGNNFAFAAFSTYGAFWMALAGIYLGIHFDIMSISTTDIGWFLVSFTLITSIYMVASFRANWALSFLFFTLLLGYIFLDVSHLGGPAFLTMVAGVDLIICGLTALYVMASIVLAQFGWVLPLGKGWLAK
jgi:uncharacterized protein